jgi:hypothetical protein
MTMDIDDLGQLAKDRMRSNAPWADGPMTGTEREAWAQLCGSLAFGVVTAVAKLEAVDLGARVAAGDEAALGQMFGFADGAIDRAVALCRIRTISRSVLERAEWHMRTNSAGIGSMIDSSGGVSTWSEWGQEAKDSPMAGAAAYGSQQTLEASLVQLLDEAGA